MPFRTAPTSSRSTDNRGQIIAPAVRPRLLIEQRRFAEVDIDWIADRVKHSPAGRGAWLGLLALLQVQTGAPDAARKSFAELAADDFALLPTVVNWHAICETSEACALLSDARAARSLVPRLTPFAQLNPVIARGLASYGPLAYYLGRLATTLGHQQGPSAASSSRGNSARKWAPTPGRPSARCG